MRQPSVRRSHNRLTETALRSSPFHRGFTKKIRSSTAQPWSWTRRRVVERAELERGIIVLNAAHLLNLSAISVQGCPLTAEELQYVLLFRF